MNGGVHALLRVNHRPGALALTWVFSTEPVTGVRALTAWTCLEEKTGRGVGRAAGLNCRSRIVGGGLVRCCQVASPARLHGQHSHPFLLRVSIIKQEEMRQ